MQLDANCSFAVPDLITGLTGNDNCGSVSFTQSPIAGTVITSSEGAPHNVDITAIDIHLNQKVHTVTLTADDIIAPTFTAPANSDVALSSNCSITVPNLLANLTGADNCGTVTFTQSPAANTVIVSSHNATHTVTITANDGNGNTTQHIVTLTSKDLQAPTINGMPANISVNNDAGDCAAVVSWTAPTVSDNCTATLASSQSSGTSFPLGVTTVTYTATDAAGLTAAQSFSVTVTDNQKPTIMAPADVEADAATGLCGTATVTLGTPVTGDNCGVAYVTNDAPSSYTVGNTTVTWTVTDNSGNQSSAQQVVTIVDNQNPSITAPANVNMNGYCVPVAVALGTPATADNCGVATVTNNAPAVFPVGATTVTWTVTDVHGNTATAPQIVTVTPVSISATASVTPLYPFPGQEIQTIYLGYSSSAQSESISMAAPSGGTAPYSYSWKQSGCNSTTLSTLSNTANSYTFSPTSSMICRSDSDNVFTFVITTTDAHGCTVSKTKKINVVDPFVGNKIMICHRPPGNPTNTQMLTVSANAIPAHLGHGDNLGNCAEFQGRTAKASEEQAVKVYPNPTAGQFRVELSSISEHAEVTVMDVQGRMIARQVLSNDQGRVVAFDLSQFSAGMYLIQVQNGDMNYRTKIIVQ